jgi:hypothetical protein
MALACGMRPDHRTMATGIASMNEERMSLCSDMLLVCVEQDF